MIRISPGFPCPEASLPGWVYDALVANRVPIRYQPTDKTFRVDTGELRLTPGSPRAWSPWAYEFTAYTHAEMMKL